MLEVISEASGILIAGAIAWAAGELRRISHAIRDLDLRVSCLERLLGQRVQQHPGRTDDPFSTEVRSSGRSSGSDRPRGGG